MADETPRRRYYWQRHTDGQGRWLTGESPPGADLAALRRGLGKDPGAVPEMWRYYTTLNPAGTWTPQLAAEHLALTLFAVHQQSKQDPMHRDGVVFAFGSAVRALHKKFSPDAVDRRFAAAATATSPNELGMHLRGLVSQLHDIGQPLDYTLLLADLVAWHNPARIPAVRRRWGSQYFAWKAEPADPAGTTDETASA